MLHERVNEFVFNILSTYEVIWRRCQGLESHLDESGIKLGTPGYKTSGLSTTPRRLLGLILHICIVVYNV